MTDQQPTIPPFAEVPKTATSGKITAEFVTKDDARAPSVHCSTIAVAGGIRYLAWFGGSGEGKPDVKIWFSKYVNGNWTDQVSVAGDGTLPHWNPVLFIPDPVNEPKHVYLFFRTGKLISSWITYIIESTDGGDSWSEPKELVQGDRSGGRGPQKNAPIVLSNGDWCTGASYEVPNPDPSKPYGVWDSYSDFAPKPKEGDTFKQGDVWIKSPLVELPADRGVPGGSFPGEGAIQPGLWESKDAPGHVHLTLRSSAGCILRSDSEDYGRTWTPAYRTILPNNNSGHDIARLKDGRVIWTGNYNTRNWGPRTPLCLMISQDDGQTWKLWATVEQAPPPHDEIRLTGADAGGVDGLEEYSYPSIVPLEDDDGEVGVWMSWTWQRRGIKVAKIVEA
ncbi:BNR repeat-like domain-domain-containing protein [Kockovaella imperatae]|uniref:BNR repeat-like domain-domain-containing protein n=1 Tax=Kockovaella imperatae TaxID=4999 RepID=A0A1Y1UPB8_9TREE|nr:BNR repeat-like domain-domain-containing protein [Kockovaella imperatae]ORX38975.1 BNR repeat-like domain-domain-containing protein [Kockovaella imperatae]